jgi:hypothetical protein
MILLMTVTTAMVLQIAGLVVALASYAMMLTLMKVLLHASGGVITDVINTPPVYYRLLALVDGLPLKNSTYV